MRGVLQINMHIYAASYLLPINGSPIEGGAVAVDNGRIVAVGRVDELRKQFTAQIQEFPGAVLMPGLVNAHTHLELTHFPQWCHQNGLDNSNNSYVDWIIQVIKVKRGIEFAALSASLFEGLRISLQNGTTMVGDILSERRLLPLYKKSLLSGRLYLEFIGQDPGRYCQQLDAIDQDLSLISGDFLPGMSPHSPFTVSQPFLSSLLDAARSKAIPLTVHLAESAEESSFFRDTSGRIAEDLYPFVGWDEYLPKPMGVTSTEWLDSSGALATDVLAVHGVHLSQADILRIKKNGSSVVLSPRSNHKLDVGRAPVELMVKAGIPLSLGTDSLASNDSLSLWDEMRFLLDTFPAVFSPANVVRMATIGGAEAIKRDHESGSLEPGKRADFIVMETGNIPVSGSIYEQLLEDSRVYGVWCHGEEGWTAEG